MAEKGGILGASRDTSSKNPLLMKAELGKPLKRCFTLPPDGFTYGRSSMGHNTGAAEALASWNRNSTQLNTSKDKKGARNFIALNKAATQSGLVSAQEHSQYRALFDAPRCISPSQLPVMATTNKLPDSHIYGVPTRPSTPVFSLLGNRYQDQWLTDREQAANTKARKEKSRIRASSSKDYNETRSSLMRRYSPPVDALPLWQMNRFRKVPAHLNTFRSERAKALSFSHHATDCTSRTGVFGHGIYEGAKS